MYTRKQPKCPWRQRDRMAQSYHKKAWYTWISLLCRCHVTASISLWLTNMAGIDCKLPAITIAHQFTDSRHDVTKLFVFLFFCGFLTQFVISSVFPEKLSVELYLTKLVFLLADLNHLLFLFCKFQDFFVCSYFCDRSIDFALWYFGY